MAGLFELSPEAIGLLTAGAGMLQASRPSTTPGGGLAAIGAGIPAGLQAYQQAQQNILRKKEMEQTAARQAQAMLLEQMQMEDALRKRKRGEAQEAFFSDLSKFKKTIPGESIPTPDGDPFTTPGKTEFDRRAMAEAMLGIPGLAEAGMSQIQHFEDLDWKAKEAAQKRAEDAANKREELRQRGLDRIAQIEAQRAGRQVSVPAVTPVTVLKDGVPTVVDGRTGKVIGTAVKGMEGNIEKPLSATQKLKLEQSMGKDRAAIGAATQDFTMLSDSVSRLIGGVGADGKEYKEHPGLKGATGWQSYFPSAPEVAGFSGNAKAAENLLAAIKGKTASIGRAIASQSGKLGNMAVQEWKIVADSIAALDPSSKDFKSQLQNLMAEAEGVLSRAKENYSTVYGDYLQDRPEFEVGGIQGAVVTPNRNTGKKSAVGGGFSAVRE